MQFLRNLGLRFLSGFYGLAAYVDRATKRNSAPGRGRLACAVISVGGLTVGGSGKTPIAARLALGLRRRGWRVVIASRGYKGRSRRFVTVVSDGSHIHSSVAESGDESFVLAAHAPGVPVLVGRDRRVVGHHAVSVFNAEILILDDGFQHHVLARDLDIVCVDALSGFGNRRLLPAGPLREGTRMLKHADWLCLVDGRAGPTHASGELLAGESIAKSFAEQGRVVIRARRRPTRLVSLDRAKTMPVSELRDRRVGMVSGVGRPQSVRRTLEALGARIVTEHRFPDHHVYRPDDLRGLDHASLLWLTTEKDAFKILPQWLGGDMLWVLEIEIDFEDEPKVIDALERELRQKGRIGAAAGERPSASPDSAASG